MSEDIEAALVRQGQENIRLHAKIERLTEALATCRELREYDRKEIERLKSLIDPLKMETLRSHNAR